MRILIVSKYFPPENSIASLRPYTWAKYWAAAGHDVTVLTTIKDTAAPSVMQLPINGFSVQEVDFHPLFYRLKKIYKKSTATPGAIASAATPEKAPAKLTYSKKMLQRLNEYRLNRGIMLAIRMPDNMDLWIPTATKWAKQQPGWDLVISTHSPYASHVIAHAIKKNGQAKKWIADFRDLWTDNHIYKGLFPFTVAENYLERKLMRKADIITTVSTALAKTLASKYGHERVHVIENGFDSSELTALSDEPVFPQDGKKRLLYAGTIYKGKQDPSPLLEAIAGIAQMPDKCSLLGNLEVLFYGANAMEAQELIQKHQVADWVKIGGFVNRDMILRMQRQADGLIFLEFDGGKIEGILTGKLFEYLSSGTMIWGIGVTQRSTPGKLIQEANGGLILGEDISGTQKALIDLLTSPTTARPQVKTEVINRFERKALAEKLLSLAFSS